MQGRGYAEQTMRVAVVDDHPSTPRVREEHVAEGRAPEHHGHDLCCYPYHGPGHDPAEETGRVDVSVASVSVLDHDQESARGVLNHCYPEMPAARSVACCAAEMAVVPEYVEERRGHDLSQIGRGW